ncbi:hypothetical protein VB713_09495 [Anabaena cylindrica UHCC 0172]|nr:hypothetical protein [Anabaena cylindrica]MEA5551205.1 hypothetical protein [Anabaena cylindrica UHCC 0172]
MNESKERSLLSVYILFFSKGRRNKIPAIRELHRMIDPIMREDNLSVQPT